MQLVSNAFIVSWLDEAKRASYLQKVRNYLDDVSADGKIRMHAELPRGYRASPAARLKP